MPESERLKLMLNTEYYYFAVQLYETFVSDGSFVKQFSQATQLLLQQDNNDVVRAFLIDYVSILSIYYLQDGHWLFDIAS